MKPFAELMEKRWLEVHGVFSDHGSVHVCHPETLDGFTLAMYDSGLHVPSIEHGLAVLNELGAAGDAMTGIWDRTRRCYAWLSPGAQRIIDRFGSMQGSFTWSWWRFCSALSKSATSTLTGADGGSITCTVSLSGDHLADPENIETQAQVAIRNGRSFSLNLLRYVAVNGARARSRFDADHGELVSAWNTLKTRGWPSHPLDWLAECGREVLSLHLDAVRGFTRALLPEEYLPLLASRARSFTHNHEGPAYGKWDQIAKSRDPGALARKFTASPSTGCTCGSCYGFTDKLATAVRRLGFDGDSAAKAYHCPCSLIWAAIGVVAESPELLLKHVTGAGEAEGHCHIHAFPAGNQQTDLHPRATAIVCRDLEHAGRVAAASGNPSVIIGHGERMVRHTSYGSYVKHHGHTCWRQTPPSRAALLALPGDDPRRITAELMLLCDTVCGDVLRVDGSDNASAGFRVIPRLEYSQRYSLDCVSEMLSTGGRDTREWHDIKEFVLCEGNEATVSFNWSHMRYDLFDLLGAGYRTTRPGVEPTLWGELNRLRSRLAVAVRGICCKGNRGALVPESTTLWQHHSSAFYSRLGVMLRESALSPALQGHRPGCLGGHELSHQLLRSMERNDPNLSAGYSLAMLWIDHGCDCDCLVYQLLGRARAAAASQQQEFSF